PDGTALVLAGSDGEPAAAVRVDLATGQQTPVGLPGAVLDPAGAALDASGRLLVADARQVVRWSADGTVNVWTSPALVGPIAVAAYGGPRCGDGIVGEGEVCDAGPSGGGCCSSSCRIREAGALCRPQSTICDNSERCDGVSPECPADVTSPDGDGDGVCDRIDHCPLDADPAQQDTDHDGRGDACDPCTGGSAIARPRLRVLNDATPQDDDTFSMSGTVSLAPDTVVDPIANGLRLYVEDGLGMALLDLTVPPGAASTASGSGWRGNGEGTAFRYRRRIGSDRLTARLTTAPAHPGEVKLSLSGKGSFIPNLLDGFPAKVALVLDPSLAASGACGEGSVYDGTLGCAVGRPPGTLVCR
ncbi:hypothetical protein K2Z84_16305, partial [Candidatus Binatia bacterium]|nr:hypothetical protein [Candidatus Binatia bacterium]